MPRDSIKQLREMKSVEIRLHELSERKALAAKVGVSTTHYLYVDPDEIRLKSDGVGVIMNKDKTIMQPGGYLSFSVPYGRVDFNKMAFHPTSDQPSTAIAPKPVFIQNLLDPDIKIVQGVYSALQALKDLF